MYAFTVTSRETRLRSYQAEREVHLRYAPLGSDEPSTLLRLPARRSFDDIVLQHLHRRTDRVLIVPGITWSDEDETAGRSWYAPIIWHTSVLAVVSTLAWVLWDAWWVALLAAAWATALFVTRFRAHRKVHRPPTAVLHENHRAWAGGEPITYSVSQIASRIDPDFAAGTGSRASTTAAARVAEVKAEYGDLLSDVVYRIECSALFDNSVDLSRAFTLVMMKWDDDESRSTPAALDKLSREVRLAFDTARRNAEAIGVEHLPRTARRAAGRAVKAARLATEGATVGERSAALDQLSRLLAELDLQYLPDRTEVPRMIGTARLALAATK